MNLLPNLLIVDDRSANLMLMEAVTKVLDVNLIMAQSGLEALEKTDGIELALAILDVRMPGMSGYELALKINENRKADTVPVIFLTAERIIEEEILKGYNCGAVDYLHKPVENHILLSKISVFLDLFTKKDALRAYKDELEARNNELTLAKEQAEEASQKYSELYDFAPSGYFTLSSDKIIQELNQSGAHILGKELSSLKGVSFSNFIPKNSLSVFNSFFSGILKSKNKELCEVIIKREDNLPKNAFIEGKAVRNGKEVLLNVVDITGLKQSAVLLQQTRQNYETFFNTIDELLFVVDREGKIIHTNITVSERLGYASEELAGLQLVLLHPPECRDEANSIYDAMLKGYTKLCYIPLITKSGIHIPVETKISHGSWNGNPAIFGVSKDITQIKLSEEKFSKVFYINPSACGLDDPLTGKYIEVNDAFQTLLGFEKEEVIGKSAVELGITNKENLQDLWQKSGNSGKMLNVETNLVAKNGDLKNVLISGENINLQGKIYRFTVVYDITERKIAEHTLQVSEKKYRTMLNASPDGMLLIDLSGLITEVSEIGLELFGTNSREDMIGKPMSVFVPAEEVGSIKELIDKTLNEGLTQNMEVVIRKKNLSLFPGELSATLIQAPDGTPLSFMIIVRDISQRKKAEAKQLHADRMANLGEMASGIAHEINQPLNIISMVLDKILFETSRADTIEIGFIKEKSERIFENITRIRNIIDHIRAFSRSHDDYVLSAFHINSAIENAVSMITEQFKHLGINLTLNLDKQIPQIYGNIYKFEQVMVNLMVNAKDAVMEKKSAATSSAEMDVEIRSYTGNNSIIVEITDNGIGISKDDINNVILPFYTTKDEGKGTGLGLSICYQIIKEMNGTIDIISTRSSGTKIKITLDLHTK